jgi:hypothetical protein
MGEVETSARPVQAIEPRMQSYPIPIALTGRPPVIFSGAFPLSEVEWSQFKAVLDAMKPVLVGTPTALTLRSTFAMRKSRTRSPADALRAPLAIRYPRRSPQRLVGASTQGNPPRCWARSPACRCCPS